MADRFLDRGPGGRRRFLQGSVAVAALVGRSAATRQLEPLVLQLGWLAGGAQAGEVVARRLGFYRTEGLEVTIRPGGPQADGVALVAMGRADVGQLSSSPSVMLAVAAGLPVRCFAVGAQRHPYAYFSLPSKPVRTPAALVGRKVGIAPTAIVLLRAMLARNGLPRDAARVVPIGSNMVPLLAGQVDAIGGWQTNVAALKTLGDVVTMSLWDAGVRLYALPYYASLDTLRLRRRALEGFVRATARGWQYAHAHRKEAIDMLLADYPSLDREAETAALPAMLGFVTGGAATLRGWGAMDPRLWQEQIDLLAEQGQFTIRKPVPADVMTTEVLDATASARNAAVA